MAQARYGVGKAIGKAPISPSYRPSHRHRSMRLRVIYWLHGPPVRAYVRTTQLAGQWLTGEQRGNEESRAKSLKRSPVNHRNDAPFSSSNLPPPPHQQDEAHISVSSRAGA